VDGRWGGQAERTFLSASGESGKYAERIFLSASERHRQPGDLLILQLPPPAHFCYPTG
jgi:hypothetical protein